MTQTYGMWKQEGFKELRAALAALPKASNKRVLQRIARARLQPIIKSAKAKVRRKSGKLRRSLKLTTKLSRRQASQFTWPNNADVITHAGAGALPHAHLLEFGTKHSRAFPFLRPAWDEHKGALLENIGEDLWKEIVAEATRVAIKATAKGQNGS